MSALATFELSLTTRARIVLDEYHQTRGSYGYATEEETRAAEDYEIAQIEAGLWVPVGVLTEALCSACGEWRETDSIWGCVVESSEKGYREALDV